MTRPKESWRLKIFARDSIADATLFSNPEYVWTTNHCFADVLVSLIAASPLPPGLAPPKNSLHDPRQPHVHGREEHGQQHHHRQHHDGRVDDLGPVGPVHPTELARDLVDELFDALEESHALSLVPESGRRGGIRTPIPRIWSPVL